ncbi:hypothetical protein [Kiloniella sp.]|uniref:hypothetical protein n=1 Tax=Kiloniella sp. TaxID=1938587 RepID=UPI003B020C73
MADIVHELKHKARILHRNVLTGNPESLVFIKKHPELKPLSGVDLAKAVQRKHCLSQIARLLGFNGWAHLTQILQATSLPPISEGRSELDYGKLLSPPRCYAYTNVWSVFYEEAREVRANTNGYLLTYGTQYLVTEADYIATLGLDPNDPDWRKIGMNWAQPDDISARENLYHKLIDHTLASQGWIS